jgi:hypothetical protein
MTKKILPWIGQEAAEARALMHTGDAVQLLTWIGRLLAELRRLNKKK